ncbi:MAG: DUF481 domain-containing protein [Acidobacteriaceae bacterium]
MRLQAKDSGPVFKLAAIFPALLLAACSFPASPARAADTLAKPQPDLLVFTNGDKLTGKLDHEIGGKVFFASDNAGMVQVPWSKLKELHTEKQFAVIETGALVGRKKANLDIPIGTISIHGDMLTVNTLHGTQQIPVKNIAYIVDQATFEKIVFKKQGFAQGITGTIGAGASTVSSTQNSISINTAVALSRVVPPVAWMPARDRTLLNFSSNYGKVTQPNTPTVKTNILHGGLEEDEYFSPRFYLLEQAIFDHNFSQGLDLQQLYGLGAGYTAIKDAKQELDLTAVMDYTRQAFSASDVVPATSHDLIGSSIGDNYVRKFPRKIVLTEVALFNPAWNSPSDYSGNVSVGAAFPVFKDFGFSVGVIDSYLNDPPAGFKGNSVQFNTGLTYTMQH